MASLSRSLRHSFPALTRSSLARFHSTSANPSLASSAYVEQETPSPATHETPSDLTRPEREGLEAALRVDQAGEVAANYIYMGQMAVLGKDPRLRNLIQVREPGSCSEIPKTHTSKKLRFTGLISTCGTKRNDIFR